MKWPQLCVRWNKKKKRRKGKRKNIWLEVIYSTRILEKSRDILDIPRKPLGLIGIISSKPMSLPTFSMNIWLWTFSMVYLWRHKVGTNRIKWTFGFLVYFEISNAYPHLCHILCLFFDICGHPRALLTFRHKKCHVLAKYQFFSWRYLAN